MSREHGGGSRENLVGSSDDSGSEHGGSSRSLDTLGSNRSLVDSEPGSEVFSDEDSNFKAVQATREKRLSRGSHGSDLEAIDERPDLERNSRNSMRDVFGDISPDLRRVEEDFPRAPKEPSVGPVTTPLSFENLGLAGGRILPNAEALEANATNRRGNNRLKVLRTSADSPLAEDDMPENIGGFSCCGIVRRRGGRSRRPGGAGSPIRGDGHHEESDAVEPPATTEV
eukprot:COSAG05_NODE_3255_length_2200_cov_1.564017_1_plen_227_part_00